jgi:uncharacterized membrane protein YvbJ
MTPETCPNCGADIPKRAKACPECGSCEATGWAEDSKSDGLNLPDDEFDYDAYVKNEFGAKRLIPRGIQAFWWGVAIVLVILLLAFLFLR